jgi:hypothetical protein
MNRPPTHETEPDYVVSCLLALGLAAPAATGGGLEDFYNSVSAYNNVTGPAQPTRGRP